MKKKSVINDTPVCQVRMQAISDTMSILSGKWKFHIIGTLIEGSKLGFMDLLREIDGIGTKMLSGRRAGDRILYATRDAVSELGDPGAGGTAPTAAPALRCRGGGAPRAAHDLRGPPPPRRPGAAGRRRRRAGHQPHPAAGGAHRPGARGLGAARGPPRRLRHP